MIWSFRLQPMAFSVVALLAPVGVALAPRDAATMIVLSTSTAFAAEAIGQADGVILASYGRFGLLARSDQPGFATRLYRNGAMLVLGGPDRAGCLKPATPSNARG